MSYDLAAIATRNRDFRAIRPTAIQEQELLRLLIPILRTWRDSAARSMNAYALALQTGELAGLSDEDAKTAAEIAALLVPTQFRPLFERVEASHRSKWLASVASATGVDAKWMTAAPIAGGNRAQRRATTSQEGGVMAAAKATTRASRNAAPTIDTAINNAVASALTQARSLSDEARARVQNAFMGGVRSGKPAATVAGEINAGLALGRRRAGRIADNEMDNFVKSATAVRMAEAGLDFGKWEHLDGQKHPRPEHQARDGQLYSASDEVWAELFLPNCHCQRVPVLKLGKFSGK